jgi:CRISPR-associated protein Cmr3
MNWYKLTPVDTLFFKGASPMNLGENHTAAHIFPPPAHTISGALRTTMLIQNNVSFEDYGNGINTPNEIIETVGKAGHQAPFILTGPLFMQDGVIYVPAPYSWFVQKEKSEGNVNVIRGKLIKSRLLKCESTELIWATGESGEIVSLGGKWIKKNDLHSAGNTVEIKKSTDFYKNEPRTGIALKKNRRVRDGHLYSFNHARLKKDVCLIFGVDKPLPMADQGVLKIGAEQRFGWYKKMSNPQLDFEENGDMFLSLSVFEENEMANESIIATGKILYFGGWDLHKGFHKPMKGFFPAGTVFNQKLHQNFITIKGE